MSPGLTPFADRLVAARPDLAAAHLQGSVAADRYAVGSRRAVTATLLDLTLRPDTSAGLATQLLFGEAFTVYEERSDGLAWGQADQDGYVGYVAACGLGPPQGPGQRVTALWSQLYPAADIKARPERELPFLATVSVAGTTGAFARLRSGGHVPRAHLAPVAGDFVAQVERFVGVPYLWGGRSARGIDCSALVQLALISGEVAAPRDSDMQAALVGVALSPEAAARRGDLIFWRGHVGVLTDPETILHANAHHMAVVAEPLAVVRDRIAGSGGGPVTGRRRLLSMAG